MLLFDEFEILDDIEEIEPGDRIEVECNDFDNKDLTNIIVFQHNEKIKLAYDDSVNYHRLGVANLIGFVVAIRREIKEKPAARTADLQ